VWVSGGGLEDSLTASANPAVYLHVPILGQLPSPQLPLDDIFEPRSLAVVSLDALLRTGPVGEQALKDAPRDPDHTVVFADFDPNSAAGGGRGSRHGILISTNGPLVV